MNFKYYLRRLQESSDYRKFMKENPEAFLSSGFFTIDRDGDDNKQHLDFFIPNAKRMASFQMEQDGKMTFIDLFDEKVPEKISLDFDLDFEEIEEKIKAKMIAHEVNSRIQKFIFSLQKLDGRDYLIGTIFLSMFGLLKISFDVKSREIVNFEKKSFFDMINIFKRSN